MGVWSYTGKWVTFQCAVPPSFCPSAWVVCPIFPLPGTFCVKALLVAQRNSNGWVVTYHVIKLPCGSIDVYYVL